MSYNFPNTPTVGDKFEHYSWDGEKWILTLGGIAKLSGAATWVTWDPATAANVTLSGGNLVATNTATSADQGVRTAFAGGKTSGKYYIEVELTYWYGGSRTGAGVATTAANYTALNSNATGGAMYGVNSGQVYANGGFAGSISGCGSGDKICMAIDLDNSKIWFRKNAAGNWNNSGSNDPTTNTGGYTLPSGTIVPCVTYTDYATNVFTGNFGATAFTGAVPSGFTSGWPS